MGARKGLWALLGLPLILILLVPLVALVLNASVPGIWRELRGEECLTAIIVSLKTTLVTLLLLITFGTPLAYSLSGRDFAGRRVIDALLNLPAVLPPAAAGIALLVAFGRSGLFGPTLGKLGIQLPFTAGAVIFAQLFVAAPFYLRPTTLAFRGTDPSLLEAAAIDGAGTVTSLTRIVLPLNRPALFAAAGVAWARALGEFGATILFAGNRFGVTRTMPLAIYLGYESDLGQSTALSVILLVVAFAVMAFGLTVGRADSSS